MTLQQSIKEIQQYAEKEDPAIVHLIGNLGAGKTHFTNQFAESIKYVGKLPSPTFSFLQEYKIDWNGKKKIVHCDFYRFKPEEAEKTLEQIGFWDYLDTGNIIFVEWPELAGEYLSEIPHKTLKITINSDQSRNYEIS